MFFEKSGASAQKLEFDDPNCPEKETFRVIMRKENLL